MKVLWDTLQSFTSLPLLFLQFRAPPFSLSFPPIKHPLQASYPRHILGGEASSSMAYSLVDGGSPLFFSFAFRCISMVENNRWRTSLKLKDPASIESPQVSFHQVVIRAQELQVGVPLTSINFQLYLLLHCCFFIFLHVSPHISCAKCF